jgi:hypothetical protein
MMHALLAAAALVAPAESAGDFFPLVPGTKWTYVEEGRFLQSRFQDEVMPPVDIEGGPAFPVVTKQDNTVIETVYYRATPSAILIVAYDPKNPLPEPRPVFKFGQGRQKWEFSGATPFMGGPVPLKMKGESAVVGRRKALDRDAECIEVKLEAELEAAQGAIIRSRQTALYAKGIGLVQMHEKTTIAKQNQERKMRLIEYIPGQP